MCCDLSSSSLSSLKNMFLFKGTELITQTTLVASHVLHTTCNYANKKCTCLKQEGNLTRRKPNSIGTHANMLMVRMLLVVNYKEEHSNWPKLEYIFDLCY